MTDEPYDPRKYLLEDHPDDPEEPCQICASSALGETLALHALQLEETMGYSTGFVGFHTAAELLHAVTSAGVCTREQLPELLADALVAIDERHKAEDGDIRHLPPAGRA